MSVNYDFKGKIVLVTGSSSGIGAATALLFAKSGADVVVTGRNADNVSKIAKQCTDVSPNGSKVLEVVADVTKQEDLDRLLNTTIETYGKLDVLVNNVGFAKLTDINDPEFYGKYREVLDVNLDSVVYLTHISAKHLEITKGNIINISSIAGFQAGKSLASYCMSKAGLNMFTKCMARELGPKGIRYNSVNPGYIYTNFCQANFEMTKQEGIDYWDKLAANYPIGRAGNGIDVANAVAFLASEQASFITGAILLVDGGHIAANVDLDI